VVLVTDFSVIREVTGETEDDDQKIKNKTAYHPNINILKAQLLAAPI
jgi:hypothetical protein